MNPLLLLLPLALGPFAATPVADEELAEHRGGFRLPGGIDVAMTIDTQTAVDGAVVLRTVFRADQGTPTLATYVPRAGGTVAGASAGASRPAATIPVVSYDRQSGIRVSGGVAAPGVSLAPHAGAIPAGLEQVSGGAATDAGAVSSTSRSAPCVRSLTAPTCPSRTSRAAPSARPSPTWAATGPSTRRPASRSTCPARGRT